MKKLLLFLLLFTAYTAVAQPKYNGDIRVIMPSPSSDMTIDATCNVSVFANVVSSGPDFGLYLNSITVHSLEIKGTTYSASELPANVLNAIKENAVIYGSFNIFDGDFNIKTMDGITLISWDQLLRLPFSEHYKQSTTDDGVKLYNSGRLSIRYVKITSLSYVSNTLNDFIREKTNPAKAPVQRTSKAVDNSVTEVAVTMGDSSSGNAAVSTTEESAEETTDTDVTEEGETPANEPVADYTPSTAYTGPATKEEVYVQAAVTVVCSLVDEMNANYDRKMARWQAESDASTAATIADNKKKTEVKFRAEFLPLMPQALNGDSDARMLLYYASRELNCYDYVSFEQRDEWLAQELAKNNTDAILENSMSLGYLNDPACIAALEKAAALGSLDAYVILGTWYNQKPHKTWGVAFPGGENPQKAVEWLTKGAQAGSPACMYYLAQIYKYGKTDTARGDHKKGLVKYDKSIVDEKLAFEWFSKSAQYPGYKKSIFARSLQTNYWYLSEFKYDAYLELAAMYKEGKAVPKDLVKAAELKETATKYRGLTENENIGEMKRYE